jgi:hypothetical protein
MNTLIHGINIGYGMGDPKLHFIIGNDDISQVWGLSTLQPE